MAIMRAIVGWRPDPEAGAVPVLASVIRITHIDVPAGAGAQVEAGAVYATWRPADLVAQFPSDPLTGRLAGAARVVRPILDALAAADLDAVVEAVRAIDLDQAAATLAATRLAQAEEVREARAAGSTAREARLRATPLAPALGSAGREAVGAFVRAVAQAATAVRRATGRPGTATFTGGVHRTQKAAVAHVWAGVAGDGDRVQVEGGAVTMMPADARPEAGLIGAMTPGDVRATLATWGVAITDVQAAITRAALAVVPPTGEVTVDLDVLADAVYPARQYGPGGHLTEAGVHEALVGQLRALGALRIERLDPVEVVMVQGKPVTLTWEPSPMFFVESCGRDPSGTPRRVTLLASQAMRERLRVGLRALPGIGSRRVYLPTRQASGAWAYVMRDAIVEHVRWRTRDLVMVAAPAGDPRGRGRRAHLVLTRRDLLLTYPPSPYPDAVRDFAQVQTYWDGAWGHLATRLGGAVAVTAEDPVEAGRGWRARWLDGRVTILVDLRAPDFDGADEVREARATHARRRALPPPDARAPRRRRAGGDRT